MFSGSSCGIEYYGSVSLSSIYLRIAFCGWLTNVTDSVEPAIPVKSSIGYPMIPYRGASHSIGYPMISLVFTGSDVPAIPANLPWTSQNALRGFRIQRSCGVTWLPHRDGTDNPCVRTSRPN